MNLPSKIHSKSGDYLLQRDTRLLTRLLGQAAAAEVGEDIQAQAQRMRDLAKRHEAGDPDANAELSELLTTLPTSQMEPLIQVLGVYFDLANVTEDLQRERVLNKRRETGATPDGLKQRVARLQESLPEDSCNEILEQLEAEFVLTAHPTEARRQTTRRVLERLRDHLYSLDRVNFTRLERRELINRLREDLQLMLRTDPLHPHPPTVLEELKRAMHVMGSLWDATPLLTRDLPQDLRAKCRPVRFGCWIGGDRDGHPHVTHTISREALALLRSRTLRLHLQEVTELDAILSLHVTNEKTSAELNAILEPAAGEALDRGRNRRHPEELFRHALEAMRLRLHDDDKSEVPAYRKSVELLEDLARFQRALEHERWSGTAMDRIRDWQARTRAFGLHGMRLDIRENSDGFRNLIRELMELVGEDPALADQHDPGTLWERKFYEPQWDRLSGKLSERSHDLLAVTRHMHEVYESSDGEAVGAYVISMTHNAGDVLWVLWLHQLVASWRGGQVPAISIAPLFETIDDLIAAPEILTALFEHPAYRQHLERLEQRQLVMLGYSDSAKDGGYVSAVWSLYDAQDRMQKLARANKVRLTCFHGRGGALGRGGGPAARAVESLPPESGPARIRMTEQGEVIADRFVDPTLAYRHMEQVLGGLIEHAFKGDTTVPEAWINSVQALADHGIDAYRSLVQSPGFVRYFREATPISCIERLQIGSRPSRRHGQNSLSDLRAIPYTFAWTQSRQLINAFYGLGTAWEKLTEEERDACRVMYREWGFFRALIDNAELALAKCDPVISGAYAELIEDNETREQVGSAVRDELKRTLSAVLSINGQQELMEPTPWLQRSIDVRKPYIDVLNHVQIELLRRQRNDAETETLDRCLRLSVQAIAAGLRSTG